jgi:hypothetical protein
MPQETMYDSGIDSINMQLLEKYGKEVHSGRAIFRLVHSNTTPEKRLGDFSDFTNSGIFIRTVREVRETLKYAYLRDTWVLEKLVWVGGNNPELPEARGYGYECIWAFRDKHGNPLYPYFHIIELMINIMVNGPREKQSESDALYEEEQKKLKEAAHYFDVFEDVGRSALFADEASVFMDATKKFTDESVN